VSDTSDRIPVPVNGHRPADAPSAAIGDPDLTAKAPGPGGDPRIVVSPTQLAIGFGIVASILTLLARRSLRGKRG